MREEFTEAALGLWEDTSFVTAVTIVPADGIVRADELKSFDFAAFVRRHRTRIKRALPGVVAIGSVDISFNTFDNRAPTWCVHLHVLVEGELDKKALKALRRSYREDKSLGIYRPVRAESIGTDELCSAARYTVKTEHKRRSGFLAIPKSDRKPYRDHKEQRLSKKESVKLALAIANWSVLAQLLLIGVKRKRANWPLAVRLQLIPPKSND